MDDAQSAYDAEKLAYDHAKAEQAEWARRLSRYDEAIRLMRGVSAMAVHWEPLTPGDIREVRDFLADEPKP